MDKKRKNYMAYYKCQTCGYPASLSAKWAEKAPPRCCNPTCKQAGQLLERQVAKEKSEPVADMRLEPAVLPTFDESTPVKNAAYRSKRYDILTKLNGCTHEEALQTIKEEQEDDDSGA